MGCVWAGKGELRHPAVTRFRSGCGMDLLPAFKTTQNVTIETYIYGNSECEAFSAILSDLQREFLVDGCSAEGHERGELPGRCGGPSRPQSLPGSKTTNL